MGKHPPANYGITAVIALLLSVGLILAGVIQIITALLTLPVLACKGRNAFHSIQSAVWRSIVTFLSVGLNPFWCARMVWVGDNPGPPKGKMGSVFFINHRSNADAWFSAWGITRMCHEARYVYKSSLKKIPFFGWNLQLAGDLAVEFGDKSKIVAMMENAKEALRQGYNVAVFPEGTRSPSGMLQEFKPGFFKICAELGCPAVPIVMLGTEKAWPLGFKMGCASVQVCVGEPLDCSEIEGPEQIMEAMEQAMTTIATQVLEDGDSGAPLTDPFLTKEPYPWWTPPDSIKDLPKEEQVKLLRAGKTHERGKKIF
mmetsp:Transcript_46746/g.100036  ORF Transcript_46746/g.100036 Transcript_46746/m.100036 type:complete len:313 (+) Transcript_46746:151-1089(+)|eukprot:CAMPEP_0194761350 /NCGR_PEP_ID=MMETSP0323_2-20130528/14077_1 /TAXON_ID=2866 ORGANISM="Crypthecodinium cohnii, Strain Seligo" /NCGR_SAMPLE_ID=MMETSP0323_2 /ASSEMBLY_ACC=CAM_ASM_000346 /LENGTH=312 /DNA_ID=CAMNT_0039683053 /DNA_START=128 /DNA_END=1066 /DNA_ORIENTATION=+